jgi:hypothetical protein
LNINRSYCHEGTDEPNSQNGSDMTACGCGCGGPRAGCGRHGNDTSCGIGDGACARGSAGDGLPPRLPVRVRLTLSEGKFHQVKRMLGECGGYVQTLNRESIGALSLRDFPELSEEGVLYSLCASASGCTRACLHACVRACLSPLRWDGVP